MKNNKIYLLGIIILFFSCDYVDNRLTISNKSTNTIIFVTSLDSSLVCWEVQHLEVYLSKKVLPQKKMTDIFPGSTTEWSKYINRSTNEKLNLFIFDMDTIHKYENWCSIITNKRYVKRYSLTEKELDSMNWIVTYK